jgi:hypothetical protein
LVKKTSGLSRTLSVKLLSSASSGSALTCAISGRGDVWYKVSQRGRRRRWNEGRNGWVPCVGRVSREVCNGCLEKKKAGTTNKAVACKRCRSLLVTRNLGLPSDPSPRWAREESLACTHGEKEVCGWMSLLAGGCLPRRSWHPLVVDCNGCYVAASQPLERMVPLFSRNTSSSTLDSFPSPHSPLIHLIA